MGFGRQYEKRVSYPSRKEFLNVHMTTEAATRLGRARINCSGRSEIFPRSLGGNIYPVQSGLGFKTVPSVALFFCSRPATWRHKPHQ
jgi:hypothetical protein